MYFGIRKQKQSGPSVASPRPHNNRPFGLALSVFVQCFNLISSPFCGPSALTAYENPSSQDFIGVHIRDRWSRATVWIWPPFFWLIIFTFPFLLLSSRRRYFSLFNFFFVFRSLNI